MNSAIKNALKEEPDSQALFHSDRGFQFTRKPFAHILEKQGMTQSMSRVGRCIDNGPLEGWQGQIKEMREVLYPNVATFEEMKEAYEETDRLNLRQSGIKHFIYFNCLLDTVRITRGFSYLLSFLN